MALTKNDPRKINLLPMMFLVCFINKGASNVNSCQSYLSHNSIKASCVARGFVHQLFL